MPPSHELLYNLNKYLLGFGELKGHWGAHSLIINHVRHIHYDYRRGRRCAL